MITKEKIEEVKKRVIEQQQQAQAMFSEAVGALKALEAVESMLNEQEALQGEELQKFLGTTEPVFIEPINSDKQ